MHLVYPHHYRQNWEYFLPYEMFQYVVSATRESAENSVSDQLSVKYRLLDALQVVVPLQQCFQMFQLHYLLIEYSKVWHLHGAVETESTFGDYSWFMALPQP